MLIVLREKSERQMEEEGLRMLCKEGHRKSARLDNTLVIIIIVIITIVIIIVVITIVIIMFCKMGPSKTARLENTLALAIIIVLINMYRRKSNHQ